MGNSCSACFRSGQGYVIVGGDETAQETSFNLSVSSGDVTRQAQQSANNASELLSTHAEQPAPEPLTKTEEAYDKAIGNLPLQRSDSLEHLLTCCICLDFLYEPVRSPCNHAFCMLCLKRLLEFDGANAKCPKCRHSFATINPDALVIDRPLQETVQRSYEEEEVEKRKEEATVDEEEYKSARADRERREDLMQSNPLQLMFESEREFARRRILRRDLALLEGMGFSTVMAQKALFVSSGAHTEALSWLIMHQHFPEINEPWNSTQLQEQIALRGTRRALCSVILQPDSREIVAPNKLSIDVSIVKHAAILGQRAWLVSTRGFDAFNNAPELVFLIKMSGEEDRLPKDLVQFLQSLYKQCERTGTSAQHASVFEFKQDGRGFMGFQDLTGIFFTRPKGQSLVYLQLPATNILFGIFLHGDESKCAKQNPTRFLLQLGRHCRSNYPFPLFNDCSRDTVCGLNDLVTQGPLAKAPFLRDALCMRVKGEVYELRRHRILPFVRQAHRKSWLLVNLPIEQKHMVKNYVAALGEAPFLPFYTDFPIGGDGYLLNATSHHHGGSRLHSLPGAQGVAIGGTSITFVCGDLGRSKKSARMGVGGTISGDGFIFHCDMQAFAAVKEALISGEDVEIPSRSKTLDYGLRIQWMPSLQLRSGFAHLSADVFPTRSAHANNFRVGNISDGLILPLVASETRAIQIPVMHPRIRILGIGLGEHLANIDQIIHQSLLQDFCLQLLENVIGMLKGLLKKYDGSEPMTMITIHVKIAPRDGEPHAEFRISKNYVSRCPQAPKLKMSHWSKVLHSVPPPRVNGALSLQMALKIK